MFPNAHYPPTDCTKFAVYSTVTSLVGGELPFPEAPIVGGGVAMLGAAMPKAPVNKDRDA